MAAVVHGPEIRHVITRRRLVALAPLFPILLSAAKAVAQAKGTLRTKTLGKSDLKVSVLGIGGNSFGAPPGGMRAPGGTFAGRRVLDLEGSRAVINAAFDAGVTFYDTAEAYANGGSETYLGEVLKDRRKQVVFATKWGGAARGPAGQRAVVRDAVEGSLRRLQTDYIDLFQMHAPDPATPIVETLQALAELKKEGKIRHYGASNYTVAMIEEADKAAKSAGVPGFISVQNQYSLLENEAEKDVLPLCAKLNIGFIPYYPLASGLLTGKYRRNQPAPAGTRLANKAIDAATYDKIETLEAFAKARGHTLLDLAIAGLAAQPQIATVIAGATQADQVRENAVSAAWQLTAADAAELHKLTAQI